MNFCTNLLCKNKREYTSNLGIIKISDGKRFWNTIKPFCVDKDLNCNKMFSENDYGCSNETKLFEK